MKPCGYCGRENDEESTHCGECGTSLSPGKIESDPSVPPLIEQRLNGRCATVILFVFLGAQIAVGLVVGMAAGTIAAVQGRDLQNPSERAEFTGTITALAAVLAAIGGGVAM